jgi:DNA-binding PadR family transcriptional regulator
MEEGMKKAANNRALAESVYYILLCLHRPAHGYALMKDIAEMTDNRVRIGAGTLYGALDNLQKKKWIRQLDSDPRERKNEYIITDKGKEYFAMELARLEELIRHAQDVRGEGK